STVIIHVNALTIHDRRAWSLHTPSGIAAFLNDLQNVQSSWKQRHSAGKCKMSLVVGKLSRRNRWLAQSQNRRLDCPLVNCHSKRMASRAAIKAYINEIQSWQCRREFL